MYISHTVALISHATKVISPSKSSTVHALWNSRCPSWIEKKPKNQRSNWQHLLVHRKSKRIAEKRLPLLHQICKSRWLCGLQQTVENLQRLEYQTILFASWEICMQVEKQQQELNMEQQIGSKSGKQYVKAVYCHPDYLTYMQSTSQEMPNWMKQKLEWRFPGEILITTHIQMTPPSWQEVKWNSRASWWR